MSGATRWRRNRPETIQPVTLETPLPEPPSELAEIRCWPSLAYVGSRATPPHSSRKGARLAEGTRVAFWRHQQRLEPNDTGPHGQHHALLPIDAGDQRLVAPRWKTETGIVRATPKAMTCLIMRPVGAPAPAASSRQSGSTWWKSGPPNSLIDQTGYTRPHPFPPRLNRPAPTRLIRRNTVGFPATVRPLSPSEKIRVLPSDDNPLANDAVSHPSSRSLPSPGL